MAQHLIEMALDDSYTVAASQVNCDNPGGRGEREDQFLWKQSSAQPESFRVAVQQGEIELLQNSVS